MNAFLYHFAILDALFIQYYPENSLLFETNRKRGNFLCWLHVLTQILYTHSLTHTKKKVVFKFKATFIWLWAYLFKVLIIKGDLGGSWLSNSWPVVWSLLVSYKETNHPLISTYHRRSWLKLNRRGFSLWRALQHVFMLMLIEIEVRRRRAIHLPTYLVVKYILDI